MANSDKNIRITTSKNRATYPKVVFTGSAAGASVITLEVLDDNTLSFTSNEGQVFSIDSNLSVGTIWAVSDISGIPILSASAGGTIGLAVYGGVVGIGQTNPTYKLDLKGSFGLASSNDGIYNFIFSNSASSGNNSLQIRSANSLLLYNSGNTFYTGLKSNAASNVTYTLPTTDGSSDQFLKTNGSGVLSWGTPSGGSGGGGTGVGAGGQYEVAYYPATGSSVVGSNTFLNNTSTAVVSITHSTSSTSYTNGALTVTGGVGIGGSLFVGGTGSSISGVRIASGAITAGTWNGTNISTTYGGTGQNFSSSTGLVQISSGTASVITTSSSLASIISDETGSGSLVFNTSPSFGTGVTTNSATFAVFNTNATTINAFGAATTLSIGASTGKATFNSTDNSTSTTTGAVAISGGAGIAQSVSIGGRLQLFNGANYTAFVSSASGNTVYTLPATSPSTGSSVLSSTSSGVLSWVPLASASGNVNAGTANFAAYYASSSSTISENANLQFTGTGLSVGGNINSSSTTTGSLIVRGGIGITGNAFIGGTVNITSTTSATGVSSGALVVSGGLGVNGDVYVANAPNSRLSVMQSAGDEGGEIFLNKPVTNTTLNTGLTIDIYQNKLRFFEAGGTNRGFYLDIASGGNSVGTNIMGSSSSGTVNNGTATFAAYYASTTNAVNENANLQFTGTGISIGGNIAATSTSSGSLRVFGGVGIGGSLYVNGVLRIGTDTFTKSYSQGDILLDNGTTDAPAIRYYWANNKNFGTDAFSAGAGSTRYRIVRDINETGGTELFSVDTTGAIQIYNSGNYSGFRFTGSGQTIYTLPSTGPTAIGTSVLSSDITGVLSWISLPDGSVNSGTANFAAYYATSSTALSQNANLQFTGTGLSIGGNISSSSTLTGSLIVRGGLGITGNAFIGSTVTIQDTTVSSSTTTGALVVAGGVGVGGKVFADVLQSGGNTAVGGNLTVAGTVDLGNATTDTISFLGRVDTDIDPISNNSYDLGAPGLAFRNASIGNSLYFTNSSNTNTFAFTAGATGATLTYILPIDTPTAGQVLAASAIASNIVTLSWEDDQTGAPAGGITSLNSLTAASQSFATGTSGTDFGISSATSTHIFNLPDAGSSARGVVSTGTQTLAGAKTFSSALTVSDATTSTSTTTGALKITGGVGIGGSLYTSTGSSSSVSGVVLANGNVSATTYNKLTLTAPATSATLTLANGSTLATSGANSLTFTTTTATNVTLPSAGTLTTTGNKLSVFASTSSSELLGIISDPQGSGQLVFATSPSFTTPTLGVASATSVNKVAITAPATSATLTLANGSTLATSGANSLTFTTTTATNVTLPSAGTLTTTGNKLSVFASTSSSELIGIISDPSGSGQLVFATSPSFTTPTLGVASATSVNKVAITAPATSATLTLANGSTLATLGANSLTFTTTTATSVTLPSAGTLTTTGNKLNVFASTSSSELAGIISDKTGSGALVFATSPDFTTSMTTSSATFSLLNATATTINAFGAATTLSVGAATGTFTHNSTDNSTTISTGSLVVAGGAGFAKSLNIGQGINLWNGANYTGFKSAASTSIQYTLPPAAPSGTGTSFLSASTTGVMAWVAAPTGGGSGTINSSDVNNIAYYSGSTTISGDSVASGNIFQWRGTSTGLNIAHTDNEFTPSGSTKLLTVGTGATNYSTVRKALAVFSTNASWTNGDLLILGVGSNAADVRLGIDWRGHVAIGTPGTGFTLPIANGTSGQVLTANTNGVASWTTVSGSGGGVAAGTAGSIAIYNSTGTGISGSGAIQVAASGTAVSTFAHLDVKTGNDLRLWNTGNTFYTALGAGNNSSNYTLLYPTAPVGAGSSIVVIGSDGQMYFATAGSGIAFSSATANTPVIRTKRAFTIQFCAGYTPTSAGADSVIIKIPESADDGVSDITYRLREFDIRVETPSAGPSRIQLEKYSGTTAFTYAATGSSLIAGFGVTLTGAAIYTTSVSSNTFAGTLVTSNDKLRLNWTLLNATHANFSVQLTIEEV
jgi:hypothetical protein